SSTRRQPNVTLFPYTTLFRSRLRPSRRLGAWLRTTLGAVRHTASLCQRGRRRRRLGLLRDAVELLHLLDDRGLHGGGGCLNEFSLFLQGCKEFLAGHTELLRKLV